MTHASSRPSRPSRLVACALLVPLLGLTACTGDDGLDQAVADLTAALEEHTLDGIAISGADAEEFADLVEPLEAQTVTVEAGEIEREDGSATVPLAWTWQVDEREWTYDTTAMLTQDEEAWTLEWDPALVADGLEEGERIEVTREHPDRAEIHGADGDVLVAERPVQRYGLDKSWIDESQVADSARQIADAVQVDADAFVERAEAMGPAAFVEAIVLRPDDAEARVADGYADIAGANVVDDTMQLAPTREFAREILGTVGEATAEIIEESDGTIRAGDEVGLFGLQSTYDAALRGTPATAIEAVACAPGVECEDPERRELTSWEAEEADPLELTLDPELQNSAEQILADETASASAIVVIQPSTGAVRAAANGPGNEGFNAATAGQYAPGSTFKVVTALALLRAGASPDDAVTCAEQVTVDGYSFQNYPDYPADAVGDITLRDAIANSCNTALIAERERIDGEALADAAASLGLTADADLGFPAFLGQVPEPEGETEFAADLIGQGRVLASPLAMATVAASVTAGDAVVPHLVAGVEADVEPETPLSTEEAETLRGLMRAVVTDGSAAFLADVEPAVGAKTGTAEYGEPDENGDLSTHAWMIATQGDLAYAVFVEDGESGAGAAGSLLEVILG
ncbi:penicillin-binding transpeptidase domain-containing protein [Microbacterium sp. G2-8]|uniref:penicillin-binding transpeptidase domain-containing protein n=1 Tax=Microbacterium sp. G2-8 TaxID=2842454 RepID=UPI001C8902BF|nr:penicillin-binding transpeptidase domain-containing protein [Microbacterium sp. G2-8]